MKNDLMKSIKSNSTKALGKIKFAYIKHEPAVWAGVAIASGLVAVGTAIYATLKVEDELEETKEALTNVHAAHDGETELTEEYTDAAYKKDLIKIYSKAGLKVAKLYAPTIIFTGIFIGSACKEYRVFAERNAGLAAAYATVDKAYKQYRKRVSDELGEDMDRHFLYGTTFEEIKVKETDENGKTKTTTKKLEHMSFEEKAALPYTKFFDESSRMWSEDPEYNERYLKMIEDKWNNTLMERGYVFWNEILDDLDINTTKAGQVCGWVFDPTLPIGEQRISFGLGVTWDEAYRRFKNGLEPVVLLIFNVQGPIIDLVEFEDGDVVPGSMDLI